VNVVRSVDVNPEEYAAIIQAEIRRAVEEVLGADTGPSGSSPIKAKKPPKGFLFAMLERDLGSSKASLAMRMLTNPTAVMQPIVGGLLKGSTGMLVAAIGVALASPALARMIANTLTRRGSFGDLTFRNIIDDRINVLRSRESQQEIRRGIEGNSQLILTTRAGTVNPIFSYNTYEQINNNSLEFEKMRAIRTTTNIP